MSNNVDDHSDLLLAAIIKMTEGMALLNEIIRRRDAARRPPTGNPFLEARFEDSDLAYIARIYRAVELHNKSIDSGHGGFLRLGGEYLDKRIDTVRDFIAISEHDLLLVPNVGRRSVGEVKAVLSAHGLRLAPYTWKYEAAEEVA
jgi:hypothetical protein